MTEREMRIAQIEARLRASTPGEWMAANISDTAAWVRVARPHSVIAHAIVQRTSRHDANFIAHAHQDVAWLLEQVKGVMK